MFNPNAYQEGQESSVLDLILTNEEETRMRIIYFLAYGRATIWSLTSALSVTLRKNRMSAVLIN